MEPSFPSSFLDRLHPGAPGVQVGAGRIGLGPYLEVLARDLENLLNACPHESGRRVWSEDCATSILAYGLPDRVFSTDDPEELARLVASTIATFEPRLEQVRVAVVGPARSTPGRLLLEVRARLALEPRCPVRFESRSGPDGRGFQVISTVSDHDER
jgi:type VI secretion system lysozyme-like protein